MSRLIFTLSNLVRYGCGYQKITLFHIYLFAYVVILHAFVSCDIFFQNQPFFQENNLLECQTVWTQIRPDV